MVSCYPCGHSREEKNLLGMAMRLSLTTGFWACSQFLPWPCLNPASPAGPACARTTLSAHLCFLCHVPPAILEWMQHLRCLSRSSSPGHYHLSGFRSSSHYLYQVLLPSCLLGSILHSDIRVLFLEKQICFWYLPTQRPSILPGYTENKDKLAHLPLIYFPCPQYASNLCFQLPLLHPTLNPYYGHTG